MCTLTHSYMPPIRLATNAIAAIPVRRYRLLPKAYFRLWITPNALAFGYCSPLSKNIKT